MSSSEKTPTSLEEMMMWIFSNWRGEHWLMPSRMPECQSHSVLKG